MPYENGLLSIDEFEHPEHIGLEYTPPEDIKQWWCASHCGPATEDTSECCGFCGAPVLECAKEMSDKMRDHPEYNFDGSQLGISHDDPEGLACGGSGFWCSGCGRFWAQDSCGESSTYEHQASDGAKLVRRDGKIYCVCGKWLMTERPEGDYD
jgi:hypothetical protein